MAGIPGTVGGAVHMNAGGAYGSISDALRSVSCITNRGEIVTYASDELKFDYRTTNIPDPIIVAATFALEPDDPVRLRERVKVIFAYKKSTQPLSEHSAGCVFRNPIDPETDQRVSAGRLIDEAGLKGERIGGASVSRHHANFVVAEPGTRANDVLQLLDLIGRRVYEHCGIELVPEIAIWKRSDTT